MKLAARRHLDDLQRSETTDWPYTFDPGKAAHACRFIEALPHVKGRWGTKKEKIRLEAWQVFKFASLFGWVWKDNPGRYRFRKFYDNVPRKNGKSLTTAGVGLYKLCCDEEASPEVYVGALSREHAKRIGFKPARIMANRTPGLRAAFGIEVHPNKIVRTEDEGVFMPVISKPGDGDMPSCAIHEEYHEHKTDELHDALQQGMTSRENPLTVYPTTSGFDTSGPCYQVQKYVEKVLDGKIEDDAFFVLIYTIDDEKKWTSLFALKQANPNYGVSIDPIEIRQEQKLAIESPRKQNTFKVKRLNMWPGSAAGWMNMVAWEACADPTLTIEQFEGAECFVGVDMADRLDLAAKVRCFRRDVDGKKHFYFFADHFLNEAAVQAGGEHYRRWADAGNLNVNDGNVTSHPLIKRNLMDDQRRFFLRQIPHDPNRAGSLLQFCAEDPAWDQNSEFVEVLPSFANFSQAMKELEAAVLEGRIHHAGDPLLAWCVGNVIVQQNSNEGLYPRKQSADRKIDGAIAALMAFWRAFLEEPTYYSNEVVLI